MTGRHRASGRGAHGRGRHGSFRRGTPVLWITACLLVASLVVVVIVRGRSTTGDKACAGHETIHVTASPRLASAVRKAGADWASTARPDGVCTVVQVTARPSFEAVDRFGRPEVGLPDVWLADSSQWIQQLRRETSGETNPVHSSWVLPSIASSPLVLAAPPAAARALAKPAAGGWSDVLSGRAGVSMSDPDHSTEGLLTLATAQAALGQGSGPPSRALVTSLVTLATRARDRSSDDESSTGPGAPVYTTSEQAVIEANSGSGPDRLQAVYPHGEGTSLDFPVVQFVPPTQSAVRREAVDAFVSSLYQTATQKRLRAAGLRDAKGSAFPPTAGFDGIAPDATIRSLPQPSDQQITDARRVWAAAQRRNRTLVVVDVSGSMLERDGDKMRFATAATKAAVGYLPDDAEIGLWAFSTDLDGAAPWRQLVSVGPIGSPSDRQARRQRLRSEADRLPTLAQRRGDTGLYRTTWDAFETVRRDYDPRRYNSVVVVTDGTNTLSGLTRSDLLSRLRAARTASRPLPVFTLAIGPDADQGTLKAISAATGGTEHSVESASDIREVFLDAVIKEGS